MATDILALVGFLGYQQVNIAGHDIGAMVAYSFAANHPEAARRVALLDVMHADDSLYQFTVLPRPGEPFALWWFAFNQLRGLPEQLLAGRSRYLIDAIHDYMAGDPAAVGDFDRAVYAHAYDTAEAIRASNGWYQAFGQDIEDEKKYGPLTPPVLVLTGELKFDTARNVLPHKAIDFEIVKLDGAGHYLAEERPELVVQHLSTFFVQ
jgi:pimeloyl-ACP methyl ester carboxylesterase